MSVTKRPVPGCHQVHAKVDPVSLQAEQANVCFDCHQQQAADSLKPSAHPIRFNQMVCGDCHSPHGLRFEWTAHARYHE